MYSSVTIIFVFTIVLYVGGSRDFYVGMFKRNDLLVAQDRLYKEGVLYRHVYAKYGRIFKCKITYFRVVDRLGYGPSPKTQILRGGLRNKYLVLRLTSAYSMPISVNIYVGCANTFNTTTRKASKTKETTDKTQEIINLNNTATDITTAASVATDVTAATAGTAAAAATAETGAGASQATTAAASE